MDPNGIFWEESNEVILKFLWKNDDDGQYLENKKKWDQESVLPFIKIALKWQ